MPSQRHKHRHRPAVQSREEEEPDGNGGVTQFHPSFPFTPFPPSAVIARGGQHSQPPPASASSLLS